PHPPHRPEHGAPPPQHHPLHDPEHDVHHDQHHHLHDHEHDVHHDQHHHQHDDEYDDDHHEHDHHDHAAAVHTDRRLLEESPRSHRECHHGCGREPHGVRRVDY